MTATRPAVVTAPRVRRDAEADVIEPDAVGRLAHRMAGDLLGDFFDPGGAELERAVVEGQLGEESLPLAPKEFVQAVVQRPRAVQHPRADLDPERRVPENVVGVVLPELEGNAAPCEHRADQQFGTLFQQCLVSREGPECLDLSRQPQRGSGVDRRRDQLKSVEEPVRHLRAQQRMASLRTGQPFREDRTS